MGAKGLAANVASLAADGRLLIIGMQGGTKAELDLNALLAQGSPVATAGLAVIAFALAFALPRHAREQVVPDAVPVPA